MGDGIITAEWRLAACHHLFYRESRGNGGTEESGDLAVTSCAMSSIHRIL
jgi:hypothetical protein